MPHPLPARSAGREVATGGVLACTWEARAARDGALRLLPDGCADVWFDIVDGTLWAVGTRAELAVADVRAGATYVGARVRAGAARAVLGELPSGGGPVRLEDAWARRVAERMARDPRPEVLAHAMTARAERAPLDPAVLAAAMLLRAAPDTRVEHVAHAVGLSDRQLRRRMRDHVGYGPKALQRVLRFAAFTARLPELAGARTTLAAAAHELGYADQAHLGREALRLSGRTPATLVARTAAAGTF